MTYIKPVPEYVGEYVREHFRYDPETGLLYRTKAYNPSVDISKPVGSLNSQGYLDVDLGKVYGGGTRNTRVHRVIWYLVYGFWPEQPIDHINGVITDNRLCNLRLTDQQKNQHNRKSRSDVSSLYKGVGWHLGKWRAFIVLPDGSPKYLGRFNKEEDAAKAYDEAARQHFGEFARLNFPPEGSVSAKAEVH